MDQLFGIGGDEEMEGVQLGEDETTTSGDEEEDNLNSEDEANPMLNHLVVGNILHWLPVHHLLKTRLVSKLWAYEASKVLRESATVSLVSQERDNQMLRFLEAMTNCKCPNVGPEGRCTAFPYSQFQVRYEDPLPTEPTALGKEEELFRFLGGNLTHLTLDFLEEVDANLSASLLRQLVLSHVPNLVFLAIDLPATTTADPALLPSPLAPSNGGEESTPTTSTRRIKTQRTYLFPKLQTLLIVDFLEDENGSELRAETRDRYSPGFLQDLWKTAPRLNKFSFLTRSPALMSRVVKSLNCLELVHLSQLHLDGVISNDDINSLATHPLPLHSLRLRCLKADVKKTSLEGLLRMLRKTLKELCLGDRCDYEEDEEGAEPKRILLQLPLMEKLQVLTLLRRSLLTAGRFGKIRFSCWPYTPTHLPLLSRLGFDSEFPEAFQHLEDFFPPIHSPCPSLKEMTFSVPIPPNNFALIPTIAHCFPRVEKLKMTKGTTEFVAAVAEHMTSIVELFLFYPDLDGGEAKPSLMSLCIQLRIRNCQVIQVVRNPRNFLIYTILISRPTIGNLTRLSKVVIETRSLRSRVQDAPVLATFTHLRLLHFNRKIGAKYRDALTRSLPYVRLEESITSDTYNWS